MTNCWKVSGRIDRRHFKNAAGAAEVWIGKATSRYSCALSVEWSAATGDSAWT